MLCRRNLFLAAGVLAVLFLIASRHLERGPFRPSDLTVRKRGYPDRLVPDGKQVIYLPAVTEGSMGMPRLDIQRDAIASIDLYYWLSNQNERPLLSEVYLVNAYPRDLWYSWFIAVAVTPAEADQVAKARKPALDEGQEAAVGVLVRWRTDRPAAADK